MDVKQNVYLLTSSVSGIELYACMVAILEHDRSRRPTLFRFSFTPPVKAEGHWSHADITGLSPRPLVWLRLVVVN